MINIFPSSCAGFRQMPWESLLNCLLLGKNVMCRQGPLLLLCSLTAFGLLLQSPLGFVFLYHSHESRLIVIWFCGWFICSRKGEEVSGRFSSRSLAAGAATGQHAISSKMKCRVLSLCSTHTNTHAQTLPQWNKTILQFDLANLWAYLLFQLSSRSLLFTGAVSTPPDNQDPSIMFSHSLIWWANLISKWIPCRFNASHRR